MKKPYYFSKAYSFTNVHGQKIYEHCYFQTIEEAKEWEAKCKEDGRETTAIEKIED